jgi:hypothetical protein
MSDRRISPIFGREKLADTTSKLSRHSPIRHATKLISFLTGTYLSPSWQSESGPSLLTLRGGVTLHAETLAHLFAINDERIQSDIVVLLWAKSPHREAQGALHGEGNRWLGRNLVLDDGVTVRIPGLGMQRVRPTDNCPSR